MGNVLGIEPYRFFISETKEYQSEIDEMVSLLSKLPDQQRLSVINRISTP
jgi:hypothetical protein